VTPTVAAIQRWVAHRGVVAIHPSPPLGVVLQCTAAEIARFTAADACLPDGPKESTTTYCTDLSKEALFGSINPKFRMVEVKQDSVVDDLMCVAVDNNPSKGSFFTDDGTGTTALLDAATGISTFETTPRTSTVSTASLYEVSDVVGVR